FLSSVETMKFVDLAQHGVDRTKIRRRSPSGQRTCRCGDSLSIAESVGVQRICKAVCPAILRPCVQTRLSLDRPSRLSRCRLKSRLRATIARSSWLYMVHLRPD